MSSPVSCDESGNCTPVSGGDIAVFPVVTGDAALFVKPPEPLRVGPLVPLAVAFSLGIALAPAFPIGSGGWAGAALLGLALGVLGPSLGAGFLRWPGLVAGFVCLGAQAVIGAVREAPPHHLSRVPEAALIAPVVAEGWVATPPDPQPPDTRDSRDALRVRFVIEVTHLTLDGRRVPATGRARLTVVGPPPDLRYGDEVRGRFHLRHPRRFDNPGAFDYPAYLATQGVFLEGWTREAIEVTEAGQGSRVVAAIFGVRTLLLQRLDAAMPPAEAGLLKATVLGDRSGLTPEMNRAFLDSGTYHILAISGLNVSLLAGTLFGLFRLVRASPRAAAAASAILVTFYAALAGGSGSVIRAAVMTDVYLLAVVLDRRADVLNSLALSGLAILWWNPRFLHDVGFQLTYLATLGIILVLPGCQSRLTRLPRPLRWTVESMAITVAATATTLPVLASSFNCLSPAGVLANIPIVPLSGVITGLGTAACALFLIVPTGLAWLNQVNGWLVNALFAMAQWFGGWWWSSVRVYTPTPGMLVCYYAALALGLGAFAWGPSDSGRRRLRRWAGWVAAFVCCLLLALQVFWRLSRPGEDGRVRLTLLDVGQGEAIYMEVPGRGHLLVDAGGMLGDGFDIGERVILPFLWHEWVNRLDVVVLTHPDSDHVGGAPSILRTLSVGEVWTDGSAAISPRDVWIQEYLRHRRIPHRVVALGDQPFRWGEALVRVVHPARAAAADTALRPTPESAPNDRSVVLRVELGSQAILLTGDLERDGEAALLRSGATLESQVLKVPHHGSRRSSTDAFVRAVRPRAAVISVGYRNPFRHPHSEVLARYEAAGVRVWRTDRHGAISVEMQSDETRVWGQREQDNVKWETDNREPPNSPS
jgi:competence protein ComEC